MRNFSDRWPRVFEILHTQGLSADERTALIRGAVPTDRHWDRIRSNLRLLDGQHLQALVARILFNQENGHSQTPVPGGRFNATAIDNRIWEFRPNGPHTMRLYFGRDDDGRLWLLSFIPEKSNIRAQTRQINEISRNWQAYLRDRARAVAR